MDSGELYEIKKATETSWRLTHEAAKKLSEAGLDVRTYFSLAKGHSCEKCGEATSDAIQVYGANGPSTDFSSERFYRDARMMTVPDGTTEDQKLMVGYGLPNEQAYE